MLPVAVLFEGEGVRVLGVGLRVYCTRQRGDESLIEGFKGSGGSESLNRVETDQGISALQPQAAAGRRCRGSEIGFFSPRNPCFRIRERNQGFLGGMNCWK